MKYNTPATFERSTPHNDFDESGGEWEPLFNDIVGLIPLTGREQIEARQLEATISHRVRMHFREGLRASDRFRVRRARLVNEEDEDDPLNYRVFQIESVINWMEKNRELELLVREAT